MRYRFIVSQVIVELGKVKTNWWIAWCHLIPQMIDNFLFIKFIEFFVLYSNIVILSITCNSILFLWKRCYCLIKALIPNQTKVSDWSCLSYLYLKVSSIFIERAKRARKVIKFWWSLIRVRQLFELLISKSCLKVSNILSDSRINVNLLIR